mgnify:CR=1 FL=1
MVVGLALIGLGKRDEFDPFFASLSIVVDKPFVVGDAINIGSGYRAKMFKTLDV